MEARAHDAANCAVRAAETETSLFGIRVGRCVPEVARERPINLREKRSTLCRRLPQIRKIEEGNYSGLVGLDGNLDRLGVSSLKIDRDLFALVVSKGETDQGGRSHTRHRLDRIAVIETLIGNIRAKSV